MRDERAKFLLAAVCMYSSTCLAHISDASWGFDSEHVGSRSEEAQGTHGAG